MVLEYMAFKSPNGLHESHQKLSKMFQGVLSNSTWSFTIKNMDAELLKELKLKHEKRN